MIREYMNDFTKVFEYSERNKILQQESYRKAEHRYMLEHHVHSLD